MKNEWWDKIERLYHAARELDGEQQAHFLDEACNSDPAIRRQLDILLQRDREESSFLNTPAVEFASPSMTGPSLPSKTQIGSYEVLGIIGKGGMGEVYRAHDSTLNRDVAIKTMAPAFAADRDRISRFEREARVLAALNHPNIAAIYGLEKFEGIPCLILELVEGATLSELLSKRAPLDNALGIARQILDALEAAHEKGILHRDLKPANVRIRPDGVVKVLDFGLSKAIAGDAPMHVSGFQSPAGLVTEAGMVLGTAPYMSPEQARGATVSKQTDIWAFGCVLFEMLTGVSPFSSETASDTISKILKEEPNWTTGNSPVPAPVRRIVDRCLMKDSQRRFHDVGDIRFELDEALTAPPVLTPDVSRPKRSMTLVAALLLISILIGGAVWLRFRTDNSTLVWTGTLLGGPAIAYGPRVSPDGKTLAFQALVDGQSQVAVMNPASGNWTLLTHDTNSGWVSQISWSRDSTRIYFDRSDPNPRGVFSIPALGGEPRLLLENAAFPEALRDGSLVVVRVNAARLNQLYRFTPDTGEVHSLNAVLPPTVSLVQVAFFRAFPDGGQVVFFGKPANPSSATAAPRLYLLDLKNNEARPFGPELNIRSTEPYIPIFGLAVDPMEGSVLINVKIGDAYQIVSIPKDRTVGPRVLLTFTEAAQFMDMAADGSLYLDQIARPFQVLRFKENAREPEGVATLPNVNTGTLAVLELPDGRFLVTTFFEGRPRLSVLRPPGELVPFVDTDGETTGPAVRIGSSQVAFILRKGPQQSIAIASIKDGRLIQLRKIMTTDGLRSLTASSDGATLFYTDEGSIWAIRVADGEARNLGPGDFAVFDPLHRNLVVQLNEKDGTRLVRMPATGGPVETIPMRTDVQIVGFSQPAPDAVRSDGQILVPAAFRDSWFQGAAILDPAAGVLRRVPLRYDGDLISLSWNQKNEIVAGSLLMRSAIWRFRPERKK